MALELTAGMKLELAKLEQDALIELWDIDLTRLTSVRGKQGIMYRLHNGVNSYGNAVVWKGQTYEPYPIKGTGFEVSAKGTSNRPSLSLSNLFGLVTGLVNEFDDCLDAVVTRRQVYANHLDPINLPDFTGRNYIPNSRNDVSVGLAINNKRYERVATTVNVFDKPFVVTARVKNLVDNNGNLAVRVADPSNSQSNELPTRVTLQGNLFTAYFDAVKDPKRTMLFFYANGKSATKSDWAESEKGSVTYYNLKVEFGTKATAWQRALDDTFTATNEIVNQFVIEQVESLNSELVRFKLAIPTELDGLVLPARMMMSNTCQFIYRSAECGYTGKAVADEKDQPTTDLKKDKCSKCLTGCTLRNNTRNFGAYIAIDKL